MSYTDLLQEELINSQFLAVIRPRRRVSNWTFVSGTTWTVTFEHGRLSPGTNHNFIGSVKINGSNATISSYNTTTGLITISTATDPNTAYTVVTYELYVATYDAHWYQFPTQAIQSEEVYYEPMIAVSPQIKNTASDVIYGFVPVQTSSITINNVTGFMQRHVYDSSFNDAEIELYHQLGDLDVNNIKLLFTGTISGVTINDKTCELQLFSSLDLLDKDFRPSFGNDAFWPVATWPNSDKEYSGRPVRYVYGLGEGVPLVNLDVDTSNTTLVNRKWGICITGESSPAVTTAIVQTGSSGGIIPLDDASGFNIGDVVYYVNPGDCYGRITNVSGNTITVIGSSATATDGSTIYKYQVGYLKYIQDDIEYTLLPDRDFSQSVDSASKILWVQLLSTAESNVGAPTIQAEKAKLYARVYGRNTDVTINSNPVGTDGTRTGVMDNASAIIVDLLKSQIGISDSQLNEDSFMDFASIAHPIGFMVPKSSNENYPTIKSIIADILQTEIAKLYIDADGLWTIKATAPITTTDYSTDDTEILANSFNYSFDYSELVSDIIVNYRIGEGVFIDDNIDAYKAIPQRVSSNYATYVHNVTKQRSFDSLHIHSSDALEYATRLSYIFGDRLGKVSVSLKNRFLETTLGDNYSISRVTLPGFELDLDIERTRNFTVVDSLRSLSQVVLQLDDQKGLEDNSGSW